MATTITPNMSLPVPVVGQEAGPQYATDVNNSLTIVDGHNHTPGYGVQIPTGGLNINSDLPINGNNIASTRSLRLQTQPGALTGASDVGSIYNFSGNLYYNNNSGVAVQITNGSSIAGSTGSISGLSSPASASYVSSSQAFVWQSNTNTPANMDNGSVTIRQVTASPNGVTISSPNSLAANYTLTLPTALGGSNLPLSVDASGNMSVGQITLAQLVTSIQQSLNPPGTILAFGGPISNIPSGYLYCDGSEVSRTTYAALFTAIGTAWGSGDGSTTFNLPLTPGLFLRGQDNGYRFDPDASSRSAAEVGGNTGDNVGSYQPTAFQSHVHQFGLFNNSGLINSYNFQYIDFTTNKTGGSGPGFASTFFGNSNPPVTQEGFAIQAAGQSTNQTMPSNVYVNYMIKY